MEDSQIQGSEAWHVSRMGFVTASRVSDVVGKTKTGYGAAREAYMAQLIAERLTGKRAEGFTSDAIEHGVETEPIARAAYEAFSDVLVEQVGSVPHPSIERSSASPDGLVGHDGLIEIKCPNTSTHIDTLLGAKIKKKYFDQMQWQMACTGRKWCDFVSYDPRLEGMELHIQRVMYDEKYVANLEEEVKKFLKELDDKIEQLNKLKEK